MRHEALEVSGVTVQARAGVALHHAIREAVILALTEDRPVELTHNDRRYRIVPRAILSYAENSGKEV